MARTSKPDSIYRVSVHRNGGHAYAATHPFTVDSSGKRRYSVIHWGTVTEDLRFIPGKRYLEASEEERGRLVFPEGWDLAAAGGGAAEPEAGGPGVPPRALPYSAADAGKAFGDVWLLQTVAGRFGLTEDLAAAFGETAADDLLTLTYFPFLTGTSFLRFPRWQAATKLPSGRPLGPMLSESLASLSRASFRRFMELRRARHAGERLCAVDSVTRLSFGSSVSDLKWGHKTERLHFRPTVEAVAYSLDKNVPVVYTSFPEAVTDARGMGVFRSELEKAGLKGITVVTDRGYDSLRGLEKYFAEGPMVMCVDAKQPEVMERIEAFGRFRSHPSGMRYDAASRRWYRQYLLSPGLRLNLFFNPERRAFELAQIDAETASQQDALKEIVSYGVTVPDRRALRRDYYFFNTVYDAEKQTVISFSPDNRRILSTRAASGFYANVTSGLDAGPLEAVAIYGLKYDQERFLRQFRSLLDFPQRPTRTEGLSYGIQVLQYIGLLLNTWLRYAFRAASAETELPYNSVTEMLDDFHGVPCVDAGGGACAPGSLSPAEAQALAALGL